MLILHFRRTVLSQAVCFYFSFDKGQTNRGSTFIHTYYFNLVLDIDECSSHSYSCDVNAVCNNARGSYTCACKPGYSGDGKNCTGKLYPRDIESSLQAFASMRAVRLFLRARAVISFVMRAASTLKITKD